MPHYEQSMVDLIEIYHARRLKAEVLKNLRRFRDVDPLDPFEDPVRRREIRNYYEALLITSAELLHTLGDEQLGI